MRRLVMALVALVLVGVGVYIWDSSKAGISVPVPPAVPIVQSQALEGVTAPAPPPPPDPNIHDLVWEVILNKGQGTLFDFADYDPVSFEKAISTYPKVILRYPQG